MSLAYIPSDWMMSSFAKLSPELIYATVCGTTDENGHAVKYGARHSLHKI